jgi:hypothetical protein
MRFALLILPALSMLAFAQESTVSPVKLESISTEVAQGEVRVNIDTSAPIEAPGPVLAEGRNLILDLAGVSSENAGKRLKLNQGDVIEILVSQPQRNPSVARVAVRLKRPLPYALSTDGKRITLWITLAEPPSQAKRKSEQGQNTAIPAARGGAVAALGGIFRKAPKQAIYEPAPQNEPNSTTQSETPSASLPPLRFPDQSAPEEVAGTATAVEGSSSQEGIKTTTNEALGTRTADGNEGSRSAPVTDAPLSFEQVAPPLANVRLPVTGHAPLELAAAPDAASPSSEALLAFGEDPSAAGRKAPVESATPPVPNSDLQTVFHVKFVQQDAAYIDAGRNAGLAAGMKLVAVTPDPTGALPNNAQPDAVLAELTVVGIAETSAVTEIHELRGKVAPGDLAYLSDADLQAVVQQHSVSATRKYPAVISFTDDDDALDEEARAQDVARPPLPSVNRLRGRIGFDYFGTHSLDASQANGRDLGLVLRADFTRIGGTYWNFLGYWRGTIESTSAASETTLQETINRTYHLGLTYDNPTGNWVAGFGRLYLPWATSLNTIDGGYFGRRIHSGVIAGVFAGSTPDPTSWNYNPNRQIGGAFVNFSGGSFDAIHYSSTSGAGISLLSWAVDRPFIFFENSVSYRRSFSLYSAVQADSPAGNAAVAAPGPGLGSSFFTARWSPVQRLQLDFNDTYFRDIPTFDPTLVGTGLLDKYLFQGLSGGARLEIVKQIAVYAELGRSNRTGDASMALNDMYGVTFGRIPWVGLRADAHYSRFNSSFGSGSYRAASFSRDINERSRVDILAGDQAFISTLAGNQSAMFVTANVENNIGAYFFTQAGFTVYRGQQQNYNQWMLMLGYRFDSKWKRK